jgi:hypothetical protein
MSDPRLASAFLLEELVHKRVRTVKDLPTIKAGTEGIVMSIYGDRVHKGIMVLWQGQPNRAGRGFGRDAKFDQTQYLEVIP